MTRSRGVPHGRPSVRFHGGVPEEVPMSDPRPAEAVAAALRRVAPEVDPGVLVPGVELRDQIDFDSMDFLNFVAALQETAGVEIPERDYPRLATIDGCARYLAEHA
jgi:acyl carrier protein